MTRCSIPLFTLILYCLSPLAMAQSSATAHNVSEQMLRDAFLEGYRFKTDLTVRNNVTAQAVLLPAPVVKRIFGKEIANSYAVIEVNIGNKSKEAAFILHGLFLDYTDWALSGYVEQTDGDRLNPPSRQPDQAGGRRSHVALASQAQTYPSQVASVEYRLARGQLLDAQQWTARNWTVRLLTFAGTLASGYSFSFKENGIAKGIAAFSGDVVPGVATLWPDGTVAQLNRISDFGYQTNKVVTREDGEVVVAFFPIDRFLTPGLRKLFLQSPALFFNPFSMFYDQHALRLFQRVAPEVMEGHDPKVVRSALLTYTEKARAAETAGRELATTDLVGEERFLNFLKYVSLNTIHIVVDGIMSVDLASVPAKIDSVVINNDTDPGTWSNAGDVTGVIRGSFLGGGTIKIADADALGVSVTTDDKQSNDQEIHFTIKLTKAIEKGTKLAFTVLKTDKQGRKVESSPFEYTVPGTPDK